jgi:hypothetical protein
MSSLICNRDGRRGEAWCALDTRLLAAVRETIETKDRHMLAKRAALTGQRSEQESPAEKMGVAKGGVDEKVEL